ncbi:hypothetical protein RFM23_09525 [Mesorhizobium abyssinicae]|uniref:Lipoprotein n=1 Tax=Mesorhizobium abyssinicae TaxID=1209958 RepID=A0ABU5AKQ8_9HYPH|nr:hypothetical protein [Mesorhizobium abyssinicae]MDX8537860.1 hypothetical protein [Mesorhizobium abyssinicae]
MFGRIVLFFLCPALLAAGGCARSDDGTVMIPKPLDVRRIWDRPPPQPQAGPPRMQAGPFPVAPQAPRRLPGRRLGPPPAPAGQVASPPSLSSEPQQPLACRNVSEPGKRYRVVCE